MLGYNHDHKTFFCQIDGLYYRIETIGFDKEKYNFSFKVTYSNLANFWDRAEMTLSDIDELFSFAYHHFNKKHYRELFETKREQITYEQCFNGLLAHAYWMASNVYDYRRSLGHENSKIIEDYRNGCKRLVDYFNNPNR
ncbi:hypothetical protein [Virgibacillus sp. SK37]|uniref:hypothetical protein n=1 Tax=Virgibacillus sp. SK37 TaxID=403957 RepID=UPI0004D1C56A|nr:hypothetical protein [Virgibacillus sp. SK37]AIF45672.1 hypothetical protein X953_18970 [Virgibacillus sp. SK37]